MFVVDRWDSGNVEPPSRRDLQEKNSYNSKDLNTFSTVYGPELEKRKSIFIFFKNPLSNER